MDATFPLGRWWGISIRCHVGLLLLVAVAWTGAGAGRLTSLILGVALLSLLAHELGHALAARRLGLPLGPIVLGPAFSAAYLLREPSRPSEDVQVAAAGPAVSLTVALLAWTVETVFAFDHAVTSIAIVVNLGMGLLNLVPAFPLDGHRVLCGLLGTRLPWHVASRSAVWMGWMASAAVAVAAGWTLDAAWSWAAVSAMFGFLVWTGRRRLTYGDAREITLRENPESEGISSDVVAHLRLRATEDRPGYRPLAPTRFVLMRKKCEDAYRRLTGLRPRPPLADREEM